jgi:hypothetical protein
VPIVVLINGREFAAEDLVFDDVNGVQVVRFKVIVGGGFSRGAQLTVPATSVLYIAQ